LKFAANTAPPTPAINAAVFRSRKGSFSD
jgi:hypothetical protein